MIISKLEKLSFSLILLIPIALVTGPAIPDLIITFVSIFFIYHMIKNKEYNFIKEKWVLFSFVFFLNLQISSLFSENYSIAFRESFIFLRIIIIPIFLCFWLLINKKRINYLLNLILFVNLLICFDCIYQFLNYNPEFGFGKDILGFSSEFYGRLSGPFNDLVPGSFIAKFSMLGLCSILINFKDRYNFLLIFSVSYLVLCGIITFISGERMAFATFFLGMILGIVFFKKYRKIFLLSLILIFIFTYIIYKTHSIYNDYTIVDSKPDHLGLKIEKTYECNNGSNKCKKIILLQPELKEVIKDFRKSPYGDVYTLAFQMYKDNKFMGIGLNNFSYLCKTNTKYMRETCWSHPHNFYLQWLTETGTIGFLLFIFYLLSILVKIFIHRNFTYSKISFITFMILFWPIMSTGSLLKNWHGIETFFILGVLIALLNFEKNDFT